MPQSTTVQKPNENQINRRDFLKFCSLMTTVLALPVSYTDRIVSALSAAARLPVIWLEFQDCTGDSESFLRASLRNDPLQSGVTDPAIVDILLDYISLDYHETLMAPAGAATEISLMDTVNKYPQEYVCVIEGSIPTADNGVYCTIRGRTALSIAQEVTSKARAVIAVGSCAWDGGLPGANPNLTGAKGVKDALHGLSNLVCLPGCPANVVNIVAVIVYLITFNKLPKMEFGFRPYFAYEEELHDECECHDHYEAHRFVEKWGDEGHRKGWCLLKMGCRGKRTDHNCPTVRWNDSTSWPVAAGHGCIGCASPQFWDRQGSFYTPIGENDDD